jgi:phosphatidylglycerophosphatase B
VLPRLAWAALSTCAGATLVALAVPAQRLDLGSWYAQAAWLVTESGGTRGAALVGILALLVLVLVDRPGLAPAGRLRQAAVVAGVAAVLGGAGSFLNEHVVKPAFHVPRPNLVRLSGPGGRGPLGPLAAFEALPDRASKQRAVRAALDAAPAAARLRGSIRAHWIAQTGYSFPSGHAFGALFLATFFVGLGQGWLPGRRCWLLGLLLPWAAAVCVSRVVLGVHTPLDVGAGAVLGALVGGLACVMAWRLVEPHARAPQLAPSAARR